jgi:hypothetical protein
MITWPALPVSHTHAAAKMQESSTECIREGSCERHSIGIVVADEQNQDNEVIFKTNVRRARMRSAAGVTPLQQSNRVNSFEGRGGVDKMKTSSPIH